MRMLYKKWFKIKFFCGTQLTGKEFVTVEAMKAASSSGVYPN
jgi:hypothetical protein